MRYRLDDKRLPQTPFLSSSQSLETDFAKLSVKMGKVLAQLDVPIAASEEALADVRRQLRRTSAASVMAAGGGRQDKD
jgi:hypothetical protein